MPERKGCVHLYVGGGKGKTTAAVGLSVRAAGCGHRVLFCQFLKGRDTGELEPLRRIGVRVERAKCSEKFVFAMSPEELADCKASHQAQLALAQQLTAAGEVDLCVLDEVLDACHSGILDWEALYRLLDTRHPGTELVLTGRNPPDELAARCDYHTDFVCVSHPYQKGVAARRGVEY